MLTSEDCFHLGAKVFLYTPEDKTLLLRTPNGNWDLPGGRLQKGETVSETLWREVEEETGFKSLHNASAFDMILTAIRIPTSHGDVGLILSIYHCYIETAFEPQLSREHSGFGWFDFSEAAQFLKPQYPATFIEKIGKSRFQKSSLHG